ncbi:MAG: hypothetical protein RQ801_04130 [Spirochaetaceae bacterium]|nr:hypothetical protein [Spirochaetaceae bacterium]
MGQDQAPARRRAGITDRIRQLVGGTKVFALVGKSGTGKSFRAKLVAEDYGIDYIIDDGLLIQGNSIVAGKSAKREQIYMSAVRTALFDDPLHRHEVIKAIRSRKIRKILLLGTSERMVARTAERLELPPPSKIIQIEEISSDEDIEKAQRSRNDEGKHVIPVPSVEVERDYPHLLSDSIKVLFKMGRGFGRRRGGGQKVYEKSVVRPSFHGSTDKGKVVISEHALGQMIAHCVDEFDGQLIVKKVKIRPSHGVYHIRSEVEMPYGNPINDNLHDLRNYVVDRLEKFTGIMIAEFDLVVAGVSKRRKNHLTSEHENPIVESPSEGDAEDMP